MNTHQKSIMNTYTQILYHIVFSTKYRIPSLHHNHRDDLFRYIRGFLNTKKCHLYRIGGVDDHIHLFTHLHPSVALSSLVKDVKLASSSFIKQESLFPKFNGWQKGYAAFTHAINDRHRMIEYVKNQQLHHQKVTYQEELKALLEKHGVKYDQKYLA